MTTKIDWNSFFTNKETVSNDFMLERSFGEEINMSNLEKHKQSLFCSDPHSIADYESAMHNAVQAVSNWLKNEKMYTGGSIKQMRALIDGFKPTKEGVGCKNPLSIWWIFSLTQA